MPLETSTLLRYATPVGKHNFWPRNSKNYFIRQFFKPELLASAIKGPQVVMLQKNNRTVSTEKKRKAVVC